MRLVVTWGGDSDEANGVVIAMRLMGVVMAMRLVATWGGDSDEANAIIEILIVTQTSVRMRIVSLTPHHMRPTMAAQR